MISDVCANCDCLLDDSCCGSAGPFVLDDVEYCCRACAEDGECTCGCVSASEPVGAGSSGATGPIF